MKANDVLELLLYFALLIGLAPLIGRWLAWVFQAERTLPGENLFAGDSMRSMNAWQYLRALLVFHGLGFVVLMLLQTLQVHLPGNPQSLANVPFALTLNTTISFLTNTNWQAYSGDATMSYLTQMLGLGVQNFLSAASGMAVAAALACCWSAGSVLRCGLSVRAHPSLGPSSSISRWRSEGCLEVVFDESVPSS